MTTTYSKKYSLSNNLDEIKATVSNKEFWNDLISKGKKDDKLIDFDLKDTSLAIDLVSSSPDHKIETANGIVENAELVYKRKIVFDLTDTNSMPTVVEFNINSIPIKIKQNIFYNAEGSKTNLEVKGDVDSLVAPIKNKLEQIIVDQLLILIEFENNLITNWIENNG